MNTAAILYESIPMWDLRGNDSDTLVMAARHLMMKSHYYNSRVDKNTSNLDRRKTKIVLIGKQLRSNKFFGFTANFANEPWWVFDSCI